MRTKLLIPALLVVALMACNKEKKMMKGLVGNWTIEKSERAIIYSDGSEDMYEDRGDVGELIIFEDENESAEMKKFTFKYIGTNNDTLNIESILMTDEKNKRIVFKNAFCDTATFCDMIWTVDKSKKNKQIWSAYGVDSTFFYPPNKFNPGSANNWLMWRITLRRQDSGFSGS